MATKSLIIGNGFDLNIGVKSSFSSFIEKKIIVDGKLQNKSNLIYLIIYLSFYEHDIIENEQLIKPIYNKDPLWMDVEHLLMNIATGVGYKNIPNKEIFYRFYLGLTDDVFAYYAMSNQCRPLQNIFLLKRMKYGDRNSNVIDEIFYDDLLEFENDFVDYMNEIISIDKTYNSDSFGLFERILSATDSKYDIKRIISFNYTFNNDDRLDTIFKENYIYVNLHGRLCDNNIVIGYDSDMQENNKEHIYSLAKGWQRLNVEYDLLSGEPQPSHTFIFYGHSLGEQDYAQLFAYIDSMMQDINKSHFIFCYSDYADDDYLNKKNKTKYLMAINRFINAYDYYRTGNRNGTLYNSLFISGHLKIIKINN